MTRKYTSYLLRRWQQSDGREWVELQHVATGERHRFGTLADAYAWLTEQGQAHRPNTTPTALASIPGRDPPTSAPA